VKPMPPAAAGKQIAPYGSWQSPISADMIAAGTVRVHEVRLDGEDVYWLEGRPTEGGRSALVRRSSDGRVDDVLPARCNVRSRVHEYGGASYLPHQGTIYFTHFADNRVYMSSPGEDPRPLTPEGASRYADFLVDERFDRLICVREEHGNPGQEAANTLVGIDLKNGGEGAVLASGHDFYASAALAPDGHALAWLTWDHPNMPFDGTDLWLADLADDASLDEPRHIAGGPSESVFQPSWSPDGTLYFVSDRTGWWNIYRLESGRTVPVTALEEDLGWPQWNFGMASYAFRSADTVLAVATTPSANRLLSIDVPSGQVTEIHTSYTSISWPRARSRYLACIGSSPTSATVVALLELNTGREAVVRRSSGIELSHDSISRPEAIEFPAHGGRRAHAFFYPPTNTDFEGPANELPPLIVHSHGGPTGAVTDSLSLATQYWTSRGFALVDVNYGGSTGYGREYRERLKGQWGIVDVDDCVAAGEYLARRGRVDGKRMAIAGGSAGGYTTLGALAFRDAFAAGASHFGLADLETFVRDTHKFESHYLESLVGPFPERADLYHDRSPIHFADQITCPVILFQGLEDRVVPPSQAEVMVQALRARGIPVAYLPFEGEGHGFRQAANIRRTLEAELYFYSRVFGFTPADRIEPVPIENLP